MPRRATLLPHWSVAWGIRVYWSQRLAPGMAVADQRGAGMPVKEVAGPFVRGLTTGGLFALTVLMSAPAAAEYPTKPITIIVPFAAGGPTDVVARLIGDRMSRILGQAIIVEDIGGAGGTIGMTRAAQAAPD